MQSKERDRTKDYHVVLSTKEAGSVFFFHEFSSTLHKTTHIIVWIEFPWDFSSYWITGWLLGWRCICVLERERARTPLDVESWETDKFFLVFPDPLETRSIIRSPASTLSYYYINSRAHGRRAALLLLWNFFFAFILGEPDAFETDRWKNSRQMQSRRNHNWNWRNILYYKFKITWNIQPGSAKFCREK